MRKLLFSLRRRLYGSGSHAPHHKKLRGAASHTGRKLRVEKLEDRCFLSASVGGNVCVWDGGSLVDNNWTTPENWVGDVAPAPGDFLKFAGNARTTPSTTSSRAPCSSLIEFAASSFTLSGNAIALDRGVTVDAGVSGSVIALKGIEWNDTVPHVFNVAKGESLLVSSDISGTGNLVKNGLFVDDGYGTLTLSGNNTFSGWTRICRGELVLGSENALAGSTLDYCNLGRHAELWHPDGGHAGRAAGRPEPGSDRGKRPGRRDGGREWGLDYLHRHPERRGHSAQRSTGPL